MAMVERLSPPRKGRAHGEKLSVQVTSRLRSSPLQESAVVRPRRPLPLERQTVGPRRLIVYLSVRPLPHVWSKDLRSALRDRLKIGLISQ